MAVKKGLKQRLNAGELTVGSWITLAHPAIAEIASRVTQDKSGS